jgi:hypothetical protein
MRSEKTLLVAAIAIMVTAMPAWAAPVAIPAADAPPINAQFGVTYNSNIAGSSAAVASARGLTRADEIFSPALNVNYSKQLGIETFYLQGTGGYDFYASNTILNRERIGVQGGAVTQLDACQFTARGSYMRRQSDLEDLNVIVTKNTEEDIVAGGDAVCNGFGRLVPSLSVQETWSDNSAPVFFASDYQSFSAQGGLAYGAGNWGNISLIGQYVDTLFQNRLIPLPSGFQEDGYKVYSGGVHYEKDLDAALHVALSLSETSLSYGGISQNFSGLTYDASLSYHPDARFQADVSFARHTSPSNYLNAAYSVDQILQGDLSYRLTSRLKAGLGASNKRQNFAGSDLISALDVTKQSVTSFYGSLGFNVTNRMNLAFVARHDQRHADLAGYSYASTQVGLTLSQAF